MTRVKEIFQDTLFEGEVNLRGALLRRLAIKHTVHFNRSFYQDIEWCDTIEAYEISSSDWNAILRLIELDREIGDHDEGEEYNTETFEQAKDIKMRHCYAGEYISSTDHIHHNCYSEDCDTYGSMAGSKATKNYVFYITDQKKYAVVYFAYWCM